MPDLLVQLLGLVVMLAGIAAGYARWIRPRQFDRPARALLLLILLTLVGGMIGSTGWWIDDPRGFSWNLPPLASRMLAAASWAFGVATFSALRSRTPRRIRLVLLMLVTYLTPLLIAILLFHLDRFAFSAPITYVFFAIVLGMTVPAVGFLLRQPHVAAVGPTLHAPASLPARVWLLGLAVFMAVWGVALFVTDSGPASFIWVWPGDLLTSRLIAVMLLTIAVGAAYGSRDADASRVMLAVAAVYGLGVALANLWGMLDNRPVNAPYLIAFGVVLLISTALLLVERSSRPAGSVPSPDG